MAHGRDTRAKKEYLYHQGISETPLHMTFWDSAESFQERASRDLPIGGAGLAALKRIRAILGPYWKEEGQRHPLRNHFMVASEPNCKWLVQFARILEKLQDIPGSETALARMGHAETYAAAWAEGDFGLKLTLAGFPCRFIHRSSHPTPDLTVLLDGKPVAVEVTSLNRPDEDTSGINALSLVNGLTLQARTVAGGMFGRVPRLNEMPMLKAKVLDATKEALEGHRVVTVNIPGLLTCYIAPEDLATEIPAQWRGSFVMRTQTPRPKKDRLARTIEEKVGSQLLHSEEGILVVYDHFSSPEETQAFFDSKEIELVIGTFPNLAGVVLVYPFSTWSQLEPKLIESEGKALIEHSLLPSEAERCVIWPNPLSNHGSALQATIRCLTSFPANLARLREPEDDPK